MDHEHDHEYMHEHGIPHEHHEHDHEHTHADGTTHSHPHAHGHDHPHTHGHGDGHPHGCPGAAAGCESDCEKCDTDPRTEVVALMRYMVNHNTAHANELAQLAARLKELGDADAFEQVTRAVSDFEKGNLRLAAVLAALDAPK